MQEHKQTHKRTRATVDVAKKLVAQHNSLHLRRGVDKPHDGSGVHLTSGSWLPRKATRHSAGSEILLQNVEILKGQQAHKPQHKQACCDKPRAARSMESAMATGEKERENLKSNLDKANQATDYEHTRTHSEKRKYNRVTQSSTHREVKLGNPKPTSGHQIRGVQRSN